MFWVEEGRKGSEVDLLFMAESANVPVISEDSVTLLLRPEEATAVRIDSVSFKNFGKIYSGAKFKVYVLLKSVETMGRSYQFIIRTYDHDFHVLADVGVDR